MQSIRPKITANANKSFKKEEGPRLQAARTSNGAGESRDGCQVRLKSYREVSMCTSEQVFDCCVKGMQANSDSYDCKEH